MINISGSELVEEIIKLEEDSIFEKISLFNYIVTSEFKFIRDISKPIEINKVIFQEKATFTSSVFMRQIELCKVTFHKKLSFDGTVHHGHLRFTSGIFEQNVSINFCIFHKDLKLHGGVFKKNIGINKVMCNSGLYCEGEISANAISIYSSTIKYEVQFMNEGKLDYLSLSENNCKKTALYNANIGVLEINDCSEEELIEIEDSQLDELRLEDLRNKGELLVKDSKLNSITIINLINSKTLNF